MHTTIAIQINGEPGQVASGATVADLLSDLAVTAEKIAVEVNAEIVPRSQYAEHRLSAADRIEIVQAIGGG